MGNLEIRQDALLQAYPRFEEAKEFYLERIEQVKAGFRHTYGKGNPRIFSAPGRTEIGGNHTDHQHGCVHRQHGRLEGQHARAQLPIPGVQSSPH